MKLSERWEKEDVSLWEVTPSNLKLEKIEPPKKNADKKTFSSAIQKYNKWHDPKTGRFTSAPGGTKATASSARQTVVIDGVEVPDIIVARGEDFIDTYVGAYKKKQAEDAIKAVLKPHAEVNLNGMDERLFQETADTVKQVVAQYPMMKEAIGGIKMFYGEEEDENTIARYSPTTKRIELNMRQYENKEKLIEATNKCIESKYHPEGTDHNSHIVHEMGHALDFHVSEVLYGEEMAIFVQSTASIRVWNANIEKFKEEGKKLTASDFRDGLSAYSSISPQEFFAEAFSEVVCNPNPRPMATDAWNKFNTYMDKAQEKQQKGESLVGKSFSDTIQKYNPYHDPKTGRFTSAPGGGGSGIVANIAPGLKADYDKEVQTYTMLGLDPAPLNDKYELMAVLNPGTKVSIGGMNDEVRRQTVDAVKMVVEKYPMAKDAITKIQVGDTKNIDTMDYNYFEEHPKAMAFYDRNSGALCLNPTLYDQKYSRSKELESIYQETVDSGFHPQGTNYNAIVVHEMAHAIDNYYTRTTNTNYSAEVKREVSFYMNKTGQDFSIAEQRSGLSDYATVNEREFFAEAMAEYLCSPSPRAIATKVGQTLDRRVENDKYFKREYKNIYDKGDAQ